MHLRNKLLLMPALFSCLAQAAETHVEISGSIRSTDDAALFFCSRLAAIDVEVSGLPEGETVLISSTTVKNPAVSEARVKDGKVRFPLDYSGVAELAQADTVSLASAKNEKEVVCRFRIAPVLVKVVGPEKSIAATWLEKSDTGFAGSVEIEVQPWIPEVKKHLRILTIPNVLGDAAVKLSAASISKSKETIDVTASATIASVTAIAVLLGKYECATRLPVHVGYEGLPFKTGEWTAEQAARVSAAFKKRLGDPDTDDVRARQERLLKIMLAHAIENLDAVLQAAPAQLVKEMLQAAGDDERTLVLDLTAIAAREKKLQIKE